MIKNEAVGDFYLGEFPQVYNRPFRVQCLTKEDVRRFLASLVGWEYV